MISMHATMWLLWELTFSTLSLSDSETILYLSLFILTILIIRKRKQIKLTDAAGRCGGSSHQGSDYWL